MKFEMKVVIMSLVLSLLFMIIFTYIATIGQKTYYVYQVGIYKEEKNKNAKLNELKKEDIQGYFYQKDNQYYVLSMISEDDKEIQDHSMKVKGIIKKYVVSNETSKEELLKMLSEGESDD